MKCDQLTIYDDQWYDKSEADKHILKLKADLVRWEGYAHLSNGESLRKLLHSNYKRCLAMARWCETRHFAIRYLQADEISNDENYIGTFDYIRREYMIKHYCRWANKWIELAEKFKEAK